MAISEEIKEQTSKFKDMTGKQKRDYIWTYYKWWIIGSIFAIYALIVTISTIIENSKPVYIDLMFINSDHSANAREEELDEAFAKEQNINIEEEKINVDYTISLYNNDSGNQTSMMGQTKIISKYSNKEIDVICGPADVLCDSADVGGYADLSLIFTKEELEEFEKNGYEIFYYTEKEYDDYGEPDSDGNYPYTEGETYAAGIYVNDCEKLIGKYGIYSTDVFNAGGEEGRYVIAIGWNSEKIDHAKEFIKFITK